MSLSKWLRSFHQFRTGTTRRRGRPLARSTVRIGLNELEARDVPATLTLGLTTSPVNEGQTATLNGTISDPPANSFAVLVNWGDGQKQTINLSGGATSFSTNHIFVDDNPTATPSDTHAITGELYTIDGSFITFGTAVQMGGNGTDIASAVALDSSGNVYTTGWFEGTVDFDPGVGTFNLTSAGFFDVFVTKFDPAGNFIWAKAFGGNSDDNGMGIALDSSGNIIIVGNFFNSADFDPGPGTFELASAGDLDAFVVKLSADGNFVWAKAFGGLEDDSANGVAIGPSGSIHVVGGFMNTVDFDPGDGSYELTSAGNVDVFVVKLAADGSFNWAAGMGGAETESGNAIAVDSAGNSIITGTFGNFDNNPADFDPGAGVYSLFVSGDRDAYICKLTSAGALSWAFGFGGVGVDTGTGIALDAAGNIYTVGNYLGDVDFDPGAGATVLSSAGGVDVYVAKYTSAGAFVWAGSMGGEEFDSGNGIALDVYGNVYVTGSFLSTADFNPGEGTATLTTPSFALDAFTVKLTNAGGFVWAQQHGGENAEVGNAIVVNGLSDVYVAGAFGGTVDFDPTGGTFNLVSFGASDAFLSRFRQSTLVANASTNVTVTNVAPTVLAGPDAFIQPGGTFTQSGSFTDPSTTDTFTATVNYGDGSGVQPLTLNSNGTYNLNHTYDTAGPYTVTVAVTDDDTGVGTDTVRVFVGTPPSVSSLVLNGGATQRSMVTTLQVTFSTTVNLGSGAFSIVNPSDAPIAGTINVSTAVVSGKTVATLTFSGTGITGGSLADGRWRLVIDDLLVTDSNNNLPMATDYVSAQFFRRFGDWNANQNVENLDQFQFRLSFGSSTGEPAFRAYFDYNGNGTIENLDQFQFRTRYGIPLP